MANTGYDWDTSWTAVTKSGTGDWTNLDIANSANAGSAAISQDIKAATEVGVDLYEDNTGAISGVVTVFLLGDVDGTNYEAITGCPYSFTVTPIQNTHYYFRFRVLGSDFSSFKVWIANACGQTLTTTVKYKQATIPAAS